MASICAFRLLLAATCALLAVPSLAVSNTLVINEIDYDQPGTDTAEFVEIKNKGSSTITLTGYTVILNVGNPTPTNVALSGTLAPGAYYVICGNSATVPHCNKVVSPAQDLLFNTAKYGVEITNSGGTIIDAMSYGATISGAGSPAPADSASANGLSRCPDGVDTDNSATDFSLKALTPGATNACGGITPAPTTPAPTTPAPTTTTDFLYLVNQWQGAWSNGALCADPSNPYWNVPAPHPSWWTLHGLWPNYAAGGYPSFCCTGTSACTTTGASPCCGSGSACPACGCTTCPTTLCTWCNPAGTLLDDMHKYWPTFKCPSSGSPVDSNFWKYEYTKHGSCASGFANDLTFFQQAINLRKSLDIYTILFNANIKPTGASYSVSAIKSAISSAIGGKSIEVHCGSTNNGSTMDEIWVCVDWTGTQFVNCPAGQPQCTLSSVIYAAPQ